MGQKHELSWYRCILLSSATVPGLRRLLGTHLLRSVSYLFLPKKGVCQYPACQLVAIEKFVYAQWKWPDKL